MQAIEVGAGEGADKRLLPGEDNKPCWRVVI